MIKQICENLKALALEFENYNSRLYIVGGCVRNYLLGLPTHDIDICGSLTPDQVQEICKKYNYHCVIINKKLGTLLITKADQRYEYTTFRKENYIKGNHSPNKVEFVLDIKQDAKRRDFTINSIYYDVLNNEIIDFYKGTKHIKDKIIKCVETPDFVFSADGLRLLRLVRFASELGFNVDKKTLKTAKAYSFMLKDISKERITAELMQIVTSDFKYNKTFKGIELLNKLNLYKYIFNLSYDFNIKNNIYYKQFITSDNQTRYFCFLILVLLNYFNFKLTSYNNLVFTVNKLFGNEGIKCGLDLKSIIKTFCVIQQYMFEKNNIFLYVNYHNLNVLEKTVVNVYCNKQYISQKILQLKLAKVPLKESDLQITNKQLLEVVASKNVSKIKKELFYLCLQNKLQNQTEQLLKMAEQLNNILK